MAKTVLFLDDNILRLQVEIEALQDAGWRVLEAELIGGAMDYLNKEKIHILILDMIMPFDEKVGLKDEDWIGIPRNATYTGVAFFNYLYRKELLTKTSVVVYTNQSLAEVKTRFRNNKPSLFLDKFDLWPDQLAAELDELIGNQTEPGEV